MTEWSQRYRELWEQVRLASNLEELLTLHDSFAVDGALAVHEESLLEYCILERCKAATEDAPEQAKPLIEKTVSYCVQALNELPDDVKQLVTGDRRRGRELLRDWIQQFDEKAQVEILERVCDQLLAELGGDNSKRACLTLTVLGFRSSNLPEKLWAMIADAGGEEASQFLNCLIDCGEPPSDELWESFVSLQNQLHAFKSVSTLRWIEDSRRQTLLPTLVEKLKEENHVHGLQYSLAVWAETSLDDTAGGVESRELVWTAAKEYPMLALLDSRITPALDCPSLVPDIVSWLESLTQIEDEAFRIWRIHHGLKGCYGEHHLASWSGCLAGDALDLVIKHVTSNAGESTASRSMESEAKQFACHLLLLSGYQNIVADLVNAYLADNEWFLQRDIARLACGIQIRPLPEFVKERIEGAAENEGGDSHEFAKHDTALRIALSNGTREAFDSLLNFGYTYQGAVLLEWSQSLSYLAIDLCRRGEAGILDALAEKLANGKPLHQREAAARAFSYLGNDGFVTEGFVTVLLTAAVDPDLPDFSRSDVISALQKLSFEAESDAVKTVTDLALTTEFEHLRLESFVFLIRHQLWEPLSQEIWHKIGWGAPFQVPQEANAHVDNWKCLVVTELFLASPDAFSDAMAFVLSNCSDDVCYRVCRILRRGETFPEFVVDTVVNRLAGGSSPFSSPAYLFSAIGHMDPVRLVSAELWKTSETWIVGAKIGYIDSLRQVSGQGEQFDAKRISRLDTLCRDSADAVRHAANYAIAILAPEAIYLLWRVRAIADQPLWLHLLAAETIEFLPAALRPQRADEDMMRLRYHRFRQVREKTKGSLKAARERERVAHCLEKFLTMKEGTNEEVLNLFPYGDALANIGNLEDHTTLAEFLADNQHLTLNARAWIQEIKKQIAKRHEKIDQEFSHGWNAIYDSFAGKLVANGREYDATFNLWLQPNDDYANPGSWGGTAVLQEPMWFEDVFQTRIAVINATERVSVGVIVNRIQGTIVNLCGKKDYPMQQRPE